MQEVSEKYNNDSYRERHALSVERLRTLPFEESVEDSYIAYFRLVALFLLEVENVRIQVESGKWDQYNEEDMRQILFAEKKRRSVCGILSMSYRYNRTL